MGFEYGYSVANPQALVAWEAQFGDFADGAQTIIDEFIASGEAKWGQRSSVTLLLPHGYEGQGPDHSSGRPERFLQLAAENNMTVAMCSTPANYFHLLRRQARLAPAPAADRDHPEVAAAQQDRGQPDRGRSRPAASARSSATPMSTRRRSPGSCCAAARSTTTWSPARAEAKRSDVAIVRVEQLYPLPAALIATELARYPGAQLVWAQEEPANQGGYPFMALNLAEQLSATRRPAAAYRASRKASASPAVGSASVHEAQQREVVATALG